MSVGSLSGPTDWSLLERIEHKHPAYRTLLSYEPGTPYEKMDKEVMADVSPITHADKNDPPVVLFHGTADQTVPIERRELRRCIRDMTWERLPEALQNRKDRVDRLIDYLISLGILRETDDARIHVPDIYLFGFDLKRRGGIRRPRV